MNDTKKTKLIELLERVTNRSRSAASPVKPSKFKPLADMLSSCPFAGYGEHVRACFDSVVEQWEGEVAPSKPQSGRVARRGLPVGTVFCDLDKANPGSAPRRNSGVIMEAGGAGRAYTHGRDPNTSHTHVFLPNPDRLRGIVESMIQHWPASDLESLARKVAKEEAEKLAEEAKTLLADPMSFPGDPEGLPLKVIGNTSPRHYFVDTVVRFWSHAGDEAICFGRTDHSPDASQTIAYADLAAPTVAEIEAFLLGEEAPKEQEDAAPETDTALANLLKERDALVDSHALRSARLYSGKVEAEPGSLAFLGSLLVPREGQFRDSVVLGEGQVDRDGYIQVRCDSNWSYYKLKHLPVRPATRPEVEAFVDAHLMPEGWDAEEARRKVGGSGETKDVSAMTPRERRIEELFQQSQRLYSDLSKIGGFDRGAFIGSICVPTSRAENGLTRINGFLDRPYRIQSGPDFDGHLSGHSNRIPFLEPNGYIDPVAHKVRPATREEIALFVSEEVEEEPAAVATGPREPLVQEVIRKTREWFDKPLSSRGAPERGVAMVPTEAYARTRTSNYEANRVAVSSSPDFRDGSALAIKPNGKEGNWLFTDDESSDRIQEPSDQAIRDFINGLPKEALAEIS